MSMRFLKVITKINDPRTIYVHDVAFTGSVPLFFGHAGLRPHTDIGVVPIPVALQSNDTYPWNYGQSPDTTPNSREIHWKANEEFDATYIRAGWNRYADEAFEKLGIPQPPARPAPTIVTFAADIICPLTIPEFDYPRLDVSTDIRYIGMPKSVGTPDRAMPSWWNEVLEARKEGKKIIAVSRSSLDISLEHVLIPTMEALKGREDILMVIALVNSEPESLQGVYDVPKNAHVAKFIPMDLLLPHVCQAEFYVSYAF